MNLPETNKKKQDERTILVWMCLLIAVNQLGFGAVIPVLPIYAQSFGVNQSAIGLTVAVYGLARLFTGIPTGRIADWFGRRNALAAGGIISALGNLWCAYAVTFSELVVARFIAGIGAGLTLTAGMIVLADITTIEKRGRTMAIYQGVFLFAVGIGPFPGGYLAEHFGLSMPFLVYAFASAFAALVGWFGVAETRPDTGQVISHGSDANYLNQLGNILTAPGFLLVAAISFANAVARTGALFSIIPLIGVTKLQLSATQVGFSMAIGSIMGLLLTYPAGMLADRFGRKAVIVPATIGTGLAFLMYGIAPAFGWFLVASTIWGVASSASGAAPTAYAADIAPRAHTATAMGTFRTLSDVGYVIGPILLGAIADGLGMTTALIVASVMLVAVALLFAQRAPESYNRDQP